MAVDEAPEGRSSDPLRGPLVIARVVIGLGIAVVFGMLGLSIALGFPFGAENATDNAFMLTLFSIVAATFTLAAVVAFFVVTRFARQPVILAVASAGCYAVALSSAMFCFVSSVLIYSSAPMVIASVVMMILALIMWPRRQQWERWSARPAKQDASVESGVE